jgi:uncharacterized protein (TIGR03382 family)
VTLRVLTRGAIFVLVSLASAHAFAYGEPVDGFPNYDERVMLVYTNRARSDPQAELEGCGERCGERACYTPVAPLTWGHALGRAARFQSALLMDIGHGGYLNHDTPCDVVADIDAQFSPGPCGGEVACACQGAVATCAGGCERFDARVRRFGGFPLGENIAGTGSPLQALHMFLYEPWAGTECARGSDPATRTTNGHRYNLLMLGPSMGVGSTTGLTVQDFGFGDEPSGIVAGVHYPEAGPAVEMRANWYGPAPRSASVNIDGVCHPMALERGTADNGTHLANVTTGACAHYYFHFVDATGADVTFPTTGSFGIGCGEDFSTARPPRCGCEPACDGRSCGDDGCGGTCGTCDGAESCTDGVCVAPGEDAGMTIPPEGDAGVVLPGEDGGMPNDAPPSTLRGTCSAAPSGPSHVWFLALAALSLRRRRL